MNRQTKMRLLYAGMTLLAIAIAGGLLYLVVLGDKTFKRKALDAEAAAVREAESRILDAEDRLASGRGVEVLKDRLADMDEAFLSNDQMRRRLLALGDVYTILYKKDVDAPDRRLNYDFAVKSYERALEYCKTPGKEAERNEILRRMAEMYLDSKDYAKALALVASSRELQTLPIDRWHFRMIEAECLLRAGKPYAASAVYGSVADECEDKAIWGEAIVRKGKILIDAASDPAVFKAFMTKDGADPKGAAVSAAGAEGERARLLSLAMADFEKAVTKTNSFDKASAEAKLGMLNVAVLRKDKKAAYGMVNSIQGSPMPMRDKAESMVSLASLHESIGEYKTAIKLLEACAQNYPLTSMFFPVAMKLYEYYKKADEWDRAFNIAERIVMRGPDTATIKKLVDDLSPDRSDMLELIRKSPERDRYIDRLQAMLDKIKESRPDSWKSIQHQANLILTTLFFISGKYPQAEKAVAGSLAVPMVPKNIADELYHLDLECARKGAESPAVVIVRAKRYLQNFPVGKYYQDALAAMLDAYFESGLYEASLEVSRRMYMDDLMRRSSSGKPSKYWIKTVARIGECYAKLGNYDRANQILRDNAKDILASQDPYGAFKVWADIAAHRGQDFEAMRRLDIVIPTLKDTPDRASLIVARYLLQLKAGGDKDFEATKALLSKIASSSKLSKDERHELSRDLYKGLLAYAFRTRPGDVQGLLDEVVKEFGDEIWPQYWILLSLSNLYGKEALDTMVRKYEDTLSQTPAFKNKDSSGAAQFVSRQLDLIKTLRNIDVKASKLKNERGL